MHFKRKNNSYRVIICMLLLFIRCIFANWWLLSQYNLSSIGIHVLCDQIPALERIQRSYCHRFPSVMKSISDGVKIGIKECQQQFKYHRWNCSTNERDISLFGKQVLTSLSREKAFIYAITSAGVVNSITRWCSQGLLTNCACDPLRKGRSKDIYGEFSWGGCSHYFRFATIFARKFIDSRENNLKDATALMNLHNNRVGRKAVLRHVRLICKCHGVSGSCIVRTCWRIISDFRTVSNYLKYKYNKAIHVNMNQAGNQLTSFDIKWKPFKSDDLIFLDFSPDYCNINRKSGTFGTEGRVCNRTSIGPDSCDMMCCGRGYQTRKVLVKYKCNCKFFWCCQVKCQECKKIRDVYTCRSVSEHQINLINY